MSTTIRLHSVANRRFFRDDQLEELLWLGRLSSDRCVVQRSLFVYCAFCWRRKSI